MRTSVLAMLHSLIGISLMHARTRMPAFRSQGTYTRSSISTNRCGTFKTRLAANVQYAYLRSIGRMPALRGDGDWVTIGR